MYHMMACTGQQSLPWKCINLKLRILCGNEEIFWNAKYEDISSWLRRQNLHRRRSCHGHIQSNLRLGQPSEYFHLSSMQEGRCIHSASQPSDIECLKTPYFSPNISFSHDNLLSLRSCLITWTKTQTDQNKCRFRSVDLQDKLFIWQSQSRGSKHNPVINAPNSAKFLSIFSIETQYMNLSTKAGLAAPIPAGYSTWSSCQETTEHYNRLRPYHSGCDINNNNVFVHTVPFRGERAWTPS